MANIDSVTFNKSQPFTPGEEVTATVTFRPYSSTNFDVAVANPSKSVAITVQAANSPPPTPPVTPPTPPVVADPRGSMWNRTDLVYGAQVGAWDEDGGNLTHVTQVQTNVKAAKIRLIRWQMWVTPCAIRNSSCQTTSNFQTGIQTIKSVGAIPLIGLPPI